MSTYDLPALGHSMDPDLLRTGGAEQVAELVQGLIAAADKRIQSVEERAQATRSGILQWGAQQLKQRAEALATLEDRQGIAEIHRLVSELWQAAQADNGVAGTPMPSPLGDPMAGLAAPSASETTETVPPPAVHSAPTERIQASTDDVPVQDAVPGEPAPAPTKATSKTSSRLERLGLISPAVGDIARLETAIREASESGRFRASASGRHRRPSMTSNTAKLNGTNGSSTNGSASAATTQTAKIEEAPAQIVTASLHLSKSIDPDPSVPADLPLDPPTWSLTPAELTNYVEELTDAAEHLLQRFRAIDFDLLVAEVELLVAKARVVTGHNREHLKTDPSIDKILFRVFGRLSKICRERLNPRVFIYGLSESHQDNWMARLARARQKRAALYKQLADESQDETPVDQSAHETDPERQQMLAAELLEELAAERDQDFQLSVLAGYLEVLPVEEPLINAVVPFASILDHAGARFRTLRIALRERTHPGDPLQADDPANGASDSGSSTRIEALPAMRQTSTLLQDYRDSMGGLRVLMIGGSPHEKRRQLIADHLSFASLEWIANERTEKANVDSLARKIRNGRYDLLIFLARFIGHHAQDTLKPACKDGAVPFVRVTTGYGLTALCLAMREMGFDSASDVHAFHANAPSRPVRTGSPD